jgi:hypothetical protein
VIAKQQWQTLNEAAKTNLELIDVSKQILDLMSRIRGRRMTTRPFPASA